MERPAQRERDAPRDVPDPGRAGRDRRRGAHGGARRRLGRREPRPLGRSVRRPRAAEALEESAIVRTLSADGVVGIVTFVGRVRDAARGRRVLRLLYEAYAEMA